MGASMLHSPHGALSYAYVSQVSDVTTFGNLLEIESTSPGARKEKELVADAVAIRPHTITIAGSNPGWIKHFCFAFHNIFGLLVTQGLDLRVVFV